MARVTAAEVLAIMDGVTLDTPVVNGYINSAGITIDANIVPIGKLSADVLKELEKWLAAHLISITRERLTTKEGAGGAYVEYAGVFGEGLKSTQYGQMVLFLDTTGTFAAMAGKRVKLMAIRE